MMKMQCINAPFVPAQLARATHVFHRHFLQTFPPFGDGFLDGFWAVGIGSLLRHTLSITEAVPQSTALPLRHPGMLSKNAKMVTRTMVIDKIRIPR